MITKEAIEAALNAYYGNDVEHGWMAREQMEAAITAAFAAMPVPANENLVITGCTANPDAASVLGFIEKFSAPTPAPDLAPENERLRAALEDAKQQAANHKRSRAYNDGVNIALENIEASAGAVLERT